MRPHRRDAIFSAHLEAMTSLARSTDVCRACVCTLVSLVALCTPGCDTHPVTLPPRSATPPATIAPPEEDPASTNEAPQENDVLPIVVLRPRAPLPRGAIGIPLRTRRDASGRHAR